MSDHAKLEAGVERILDIFATRVDRPIYGLMQHEFGARFKSDGCTMTDFKTAMEFAFHEGWVEINAQFYRLTEAGARKLKTTLAKPS